MKQFLIDTNIIIYILKKDEIIIPFLEKMHGAIFFISIISQIETLAGSHFHGKTIHELQNDLRTFITIPVNTTIGQKTAHLLQKNSLKIKKIDFQDAIIAATAIVHHIPLITNNPKDFRKFKGLKIIPAA